MSHKCRHAANCLVACVFVHRLDINALSIFRTLPGVRAGGLVVVVVCAGGVTLYTVRLCVKVCECGTGNVSRH